MLAVRDHIDRLGDATVAVVTFSSGPLLAAYADEHRLPFPLLSDPDRRAYRAYGLERGRRLRVWGLRSGIAYAGLLRRGRRFRRPVEDTLQLGGDFVIAPDGTLAYTFWSEGPDDRPPVAELVDAVSRTRR